jgi:spore cortex formation protein SpoVR/YcgB (stage V sporulation)
LREDPVSEGEFAEYAESVGAKSLSQLLEAAAAYMSYVEGRDQFSRPQLMTTVRQAEETESSREDRLRSFGQLLRDGKIEKTSGGRFTSSETNSFKPAQAAG